MDEQSTDGIYALSLKVAFQDDLLIEIGDMNVQKGWELRGI